MITIPDHTVIRPIARGAYGEVWLAHNITGTWRAVKFVRRDSFREARPFDREFDGIRRYEPISRSHEGLVDVLHVGRDDEGGWFYYVMEIADDLSCGRDIIPEKYKPRTLSAVLRERGRMSFNECLRLAQTLAGALGHLHNEGLIHRDVKPSNIIFVHNTPMLADIGLVAEAGESRSFVGTEGFVPREGPGTVQADIFGLGKVLYQALTGNDHTDFPKLPRDWNTLADREDRLELNEIILRCCDDNPARRYQNTGELLEHIKLLAGGKSVRRLRKLESRLRFARWAGLAVAVSATAAIALSVYFRKRATFEKGLRAEAESRLVESSLARARAARNSKVAGDRLAGLNAIREGARIRPTPELRENALALIAHPDLRRRSEHTVVDRTKQYLYADVPHGRFVEGPVDGKLVLRAMGDRRELGTLRLHIPPTYQWRATFSPDGRWLAYTHPGQAIQLFDITSGSTTFPGTPANVPGGWPAKVEFSADSRELRWLDGGGTLVATSLERPSEARRIPLPKASNPSIKWTRDGRRIAYECASGHVHIADSATGEDITNITVKGEIRDFLWASDGRALTIVTFQGAVDTWHFPDDKPALLRELYPLEGSALLNACWVGGDDLIAVTGWGGWIYLISIPENRVICRDLTAGDDLAYHDGTLVVHDWGRQILTAFDCRRSGVFHTSISSLYSHHRPDFSPDGKWLAAPARPGVLLWPIPPTPGTLPLVERTPHENMSVHFAPDRTLAAYGNGPPKIWDYTPGPRPLINIRDGNPEQWSTTAFSTDDTRSISAVAEGLAYFENGTRARTWHLQDATGARPGFGTYAAISPDGRHALVSPYNMNRWWFIHTATDKPIEFTQAEGGAGLSFSPNGKWFAVGDGNNVTIFETDTRRKVHQWERGKGIRIRTRPAWSADGKFIAFNRTLDALHIASTATWEEKLTLTLPSGNALGQAVFSPDGRHIAVSDSTNGMTFWDLATAAEELRKLGL